MSALRASPFHVRMAEHNSGNAWFARGGFTVPARFGDPRQEALAARFSTVMIDVSAVARLRVHGAGAAKFLSAAFAADMGALAPGSSQRVAWLSDGGGVRGIGIAARFGASNFTLSSFDIDGAWFQGSARRFDASVRDETDEKGMLLIAGPLAPDLLAAAGLANASRLERGFHAVQLWRGITVTVSRWGAALNSYEIACCNVDALLVFDRLWRAGHDLGLTLAGQEAFETLLLEQGVLIPGIDFAPARDALTRQPTPASVGLTELARSAASNSRVFTGVEMDSDMPMPFAPILQGGAIVGATLRSVYSPALRRAIALAQLDDAYSATGTAVIVSRLSASGVEDVPARVTQLPFIKPIS